MYRDFGRDPEKGSCAIRGTKYRISDFAAAVLIAQPTRFDELCAKREKHAAYLKRELKNIPGMLPQEHYPESTRQNYYCFGLRYDKEHFSGAPRAKVVEAVSAEGLPVTPIYTPLHKEPFIEENLNSRGFQAAFSKERLEKYRRQNHLAQNDELCATSLYLPQEALIGEKSDVDDVVEAFNKVQKNAATLV